MTGLESYRPWALARLALRVARHPRAPWICAALAFLLSIPMWGVGYMLDDNVHTWVLRGNHFPGGPRGSWDLYRFADGGSGLEQSTRAGVFPWWSSPELKLAFFRPIPSLWRAADFSLFGDRAWVSHVEASLVFVALVLAAAATYRRVFSCSDMAPAPKAGVALTLAGVATLLFALDDAHGMVVGWIANRYALLSATFGLVSLALTLPPIGARALPRWQRVVSPLAFGLALASGEVGAGLFGYLLAFAWWGPADRRRALVSLTPHAALLAAYTAVYISLGYGAYASSFYIDPLRSPGAFAVAVFERLPRLALSQFAFPPAEIWQILPVSGRWVYAAITVTGALLLIGALLRVTKLDNTVRMLGAGALLSAVPVCAVNPADRLLLLPGFGAFGILAIFLLRVWEQGGSRRRRALAGLFAVLHLGLAPLLLPLGMLNFVKSFRPIVERGTASLPTDPGIVRQHLVVLSTPDALLTQNMFTLRILDGAPAPLSAAVVSVQDRGSPSLRRSGERTFIVQNPDGQNLSMFSPVFRDGPLRVGTRRETDVMTVTVLETRPADGALVSIEVELRLPLDQLRFVVWKKGRGFEEVLLPAIGETLELPTATIFDPQ
ncbi:MAG: hypothetical protein U0271_00960 [Polyangiaceae bacterium]